MIFKKISYKPSNSDDDKDTFFLRVDNWDDYSFKTTFNLSYIDNNGELYDIGVIKIGYFEYSIPTSKYISDEPFEKLNESCFSLGQTKEYYKNIKKILSEDKMVSLLKALRDIVFDKRLYNLVKNEDIVGLSLMRVVSESEIYNHFTRILDGGAVLTDFNFLYIRQESDKNSGLKLKFDVKPNSKPPTNIHVLIGRNGVGKTTLLNNMIYSLIPTNNNINYEGFFIENILSKNIAIPKDYFSKIVSISFSIFDKFIPPSEKNDNNNKLQYYYIGLKKFTDKNNEKISILKEPPELCEDFVNSLIKCFDIKIKRDLWLRAIINLESDMNFAEMQLTELAYIDNKEQLKKKAAFLYDKMSSGHAIVLLSMTRLVETVEEKTLVLIDEPESHLHPPLLSAYIRALSNLLINRNGVAIIATHSPVILQEVPKSCVWKLRRTRLIVNAERPEEETFAENVGILTREVFGLEVSQSGFHEFLLNAVAEDKNYEQIIQEFRDQLGFEGKAILRGLLAYKQKNDKQENQ